MKKNILQRIKWRNVIFSLLLTAGTGAAVVNAYDYITTPPELIEYRKVIGWGDTVWSVCEEIATDQDDLRRLVWQTCKDNHITDPRHVDPGTVLIVRVREARKQ